MKHNHILWRQILLTAIIFTLAWSDNPHLPKIKLKDLNNKRQSISQYYSDGPLLINFWNLACEPCKKEMKELDKLHLKYEKEGFEVVSINIDNSRNMSKVKSYVKSQKYAFTVLSDPRAELFRKMGGKVMPFVIIADTTGKIINRHVGYSPGDEIRLEKEILHLLQPAGENPDSLKADTKPKRTPPITNPDLEVVPEENTPE